jgi:Amt family ammonium transporter
MVRTKSTSAICVKNIGLFSIAGVTYAIVGYNLMYSGVDGGFIGSLGLFDAPDPAAEAAEGGYAAASDWFFQVVFVATTASIVSGAVAERVRVIPFLLVIAVLVAVIYPVQGAWSWGGGWLSELGFSDFAGSTIVHSVGGWCALAGIILLGARHGKFSADGKVNPVQASAVPLVALGAFVLWIGWLGFNGGSQLALGSAADASAMARIYANTYLAGCGGALAAAATYFAVYRKLDITLILNGVLGGLVSITAEPLAPSFVQAILIGGVGGVIVALGVPFLDRLRLDDVVGAVPVHLFAGVWGTIAVCLTNPEASLVAQLIGIVAIGLFAFAGSLLVWYVVKLILGIRLDEEAEMHGSDLTEVGVVSYPEFVAGRSG